MTEERVIFRPDFLKPVSETSLGRCLYESLTKAPRDRPLYVDPTLNNILTHSDFLKLCCRLAKSLRNYGYKLNDILTVASENNIYYFLPVVAALYIGAITAPLNYSYKEKELFHLLNIVQPRIVFCSKPVLKRYVELKDRVRSIEKIILLNPLEKVVGYQNLFEFMDEYSAEDEPIRDFNPVDVDTFEQVAALLSSSGTTGMPKEVIFSHDNILTRISHLFDRRFYSSEPQVIFGIQPFSHAMGFIHSLTAIMRYDSVIVLKRFDLDLYLECIEKYKVTILGTVPVMLNALVRSPRVFYCDLSSVKEITVGGASTSPELEETARKRFPNLKRFSQGYGLTEATLALTQMPYNEICVGSIGKLLPGTSIKIIDPVTGLSLGPNQPGEICAKGRLITKGYYKNPEITNKTFRNGWLHTGDVGFYNENEYFFVIDRLKELIKYKSFQVAPAELEGLLLSHPDVKDAGVVGKPDEVAGELPTAFVVKRANSKVTEEDLQKFVSDQLSNPKHLRGGVYFLEEIPKTSSNKIERVRLKRILSKKISKL